MFEMIDTERYCDLDGVCDTSPSTLFGGGGGSFVRTKVGA